MKVRVVRDWHTKARTVRVTLTGRETLNYALAERLKHTDLPFLPPFKYQIKGDSAVLFYDITGCMKIRKFMEAKISVGQYQDIIRSVADITDICTEASAPTESVLWDKKYIYISQPVPHPVYIIVPAHGIAPGHPTANDLLMYLSDASKVHFPNDDGNIYVEIVRDYVRRNPIFSSVTLRDWMVKKGVIAQAGMSSGQFLSPDMGTAAQNRQPPAQAMQLQPPLPAPPAASVPAGGFTQGPGWDPVGTVLGENGAVERGSLGESVVKEVSRVPDTSRKDDNAYTPVVDSALLTMMPSAGGAGFAQAGSTSSSQLVARQGTAQASAGAAQGSPVQQYSQQPSLYGLQESQPMVQQQPGLYASGAAVQAQPLRQPVSPSGVPAQAARQAPLAYPQMPQQKVSPVQAQQPLQAASPADQHGSTPVHIPVFTVIRQRDGYTARMKALRATIGRSETADIHMGGEATMSRIHAILEYLSADAFALIDNNSPNGTFVKGVRLPSGGRTVLRSGSTFSLSDVEFEVVITFD